MRTFDFDRRRLIASAASAALGAVAPASSGLAQTAPRHVSLLLNTSFSGPQAWILLADDLGFFRREGIELDMTQGAGAYTAAPRVAAGNFDFGYGDINSLAEVVARAPDRAPVAVFVAFNASPSAIAVDANGPVKSPRDLERRTIIGHDTDVALKTFGAFCKTNNVDRSRIRTIPGGGMGDMVEQMLGANEIGGVFGYVSTLEASIAAYKPALARRIRYLRYADYVPDLYGSALFASRRMMNENPDLVRGMVRAFNAGLAALMDNKPRGIGSVLRRSGGARDVEALRLDKTLELEMAHPEGRRLGIGDVDDGRFSRGLALLAETNDLPRTPSAREVFVRDFLPPLSERVTTLAR